MKSKQKQANRTQEFVKCLITRGGFEEGKEYTVTFDELNGGNIQIYGSIPGTRDMGHIYCHKGLQEKNEHFKLVMR